MLVARAAPRMSRKQRKPQAPAPNRRSSGSAQGTGFADVDLTVEVGKLEFGTAAVDGAADGFVDFHAVLAAMSAAVFDDRLRRGRLHLHVEIAEDIAAVGAQADIGF